jgi:hypothetical protein
VKPYTRRHPSSLVWAVRVGQEGETLPDGVVPEYVTASSHGRDDGHPTGYFLVAVQGGPLRLQPGDWLVEDASGGRYGMTDAAFRAVHKLAPGTPGGR